MCAAIRMCRDGDRIRMLTSRQFCSVLLAAGIALAAWRVGALTGSGAVAAWGVGTVVFGVGGWAWAVPLLVFFGTSSGFEPVAAGGQREAGLRKGRAAGCRAGGGERRRRRLLCVLLPLLFPQIRAAHAYLLFLAALAAANADTWGTEIGSALGGQPYDLRTGRRAPPGTSGAVSLGGTLAALAGAALIGLFAPDWAARVVVTLAGLGGALV